ncbi:MAG: hypothetical protein WCY58_13995 [Mariniphaga sp.]|nr:hypothetical protein [Mariniphaga sp.]MDD4426736.1 hypothetical protein [Mariniphaga sp.]
MVSDILELTLPDIVLPPVAVALDGCQDEENVYITWAASPANDVLGYRTFRKPAGDEEWQSLLPTCYFLFFSPWYLF